MLDSDSRNIVNFLVTRKLLGKWKQLGIYLQSLMPQLSMYLFTKLANILQTYAYRQHLWRTNVLSSLYVWAHELVNAKFLLILYYVLI